MKTIRNLLLLLVAAALTALVSFQPQARANSLILCAPEVSGAAAGPRRAVNPGTSGGTYVLDANGCALFSTSNSDAAYFQSQGFTQSGPLRSIVVTSGVLITTTSVQVATLPPLAYIRDIFIDNTTANAVTGGIDIGKTTGAADIVSAKTCAASCLTFVADSALLLRNFSKTTGQAIWVTGHTDGNSANLTLTIVYGYF